MKLIASGVTSSADMQRSPSFSRSSSSTMITIRPARMSAIARVTRSWSIFDSPFTTLTGRAEELLFHEPGGAQELHVDAARLVGRKQPLDVLGDEIDLQVHPPADALVG